MVLDAHIPTRLLWPEVLVITAAVIYLTVTVISATDSPSMSARARLLAFVGLFVTVALIFLGAIWPSYYTIIAIPFIPAPFVFGVLIFRPGLASKRPRLRAYLTLCVAASALTWAFQLFWDFRR
jgi:hypothetical protein